MRAAAKEEADHGLTSVADTIEQTTGNRPRVLFHMDYPDRVPLPHPGYAVSPSGPMPASFVGRPTHMNRAMQGRPKRHLWWLISIPVVLLIVLIVGMVQSSNRMDEAGRAIAVAMASGGSTGGAGSVGSTTSWGAGRNEPAFLSFVHANAPIPGLSDNDFIALAQNTCTAFEKGVSGTVIAQQLGKFGQYQTQAAKIVGAGLANYCPQYGF